MKYLYTLVIAATLLIPSFSYAALTDSQISAIIGLLRAFNVEEPIVLKVEGQLKADGQAKLTIQTKSATPDFTTTNTTTIETPTLGASEPATQPQTQTQTQTIKPQPVVVQPAPVKIIPLDVLVAESDKEIVRVVANKPVTFTINRYSLGDVTYEHPNIYFEYHAPILGLPEPDGSSIAVRLTITDADGQTVTQPIRVR